MASPPPPPASDDNQAAALAFLLSPATHGGAEPRHVETHLSHLVLAGERAFKMKKAIRWSVVDYATLERRRHYCHHEVTVNAPFAGALYCGVRAIVSTDEGLAFDADGPAVEYVVEMVRFADGAQLDCLAEDGELTPALIDATADAIAAMHARVPLRRVPGRAAAEADRIAQLSRDVSRQLSSDGLRETVERWRADAAAALKRHSARIDRRGRHGFVRRCHGDLHLSNICVWQGVPTPFDAIEFSEEIATIDIAYDLAFVLVDLELRGLRVEANRLLSRTLEASRDYSSLALLPLYLSMRAMVRALVAIAKGRDPAQAITAAVAFVAPRPDPSLIAIGGPSGSGKSTVARALAARLGAVVIRSDATRKRLHHLAPEVRLPARAYRAAVSDRVHRRMRNDARRSLCAGRTTIVDATFLDAGERERIAVLAETEGIAFHGYFLDGPDALLQRRLKARTGDASDADAEVLAQQRRRAVGAMTWTVLDAALPVETSADEIETRLPE